VVAEPSVEHAVEQAVVWRHEPVVNGELRAVILGRDIISGGWSILEVDIAAVAKVDEAAVLSPCTAASSIQ
jgi:hypothetical protein